jgi:hypothetical protein
MSDGYIDMGSEEGQRLMANNDKTTGVLDEKAQARLRKVMASLGISTDAAGILLEFGEDGQVTRWQWWLDKADCPRTPARRTTRRKAK